jgi:hypothetical protein
LEERGDREERRATACQHATRLGRSMLCKSSRIHGS